MPEDVVHELYTARAYPALSHPATHPARLAVAAKLAAVKGVAAADKCRVLEMGCSTGHNLLPLAARNPDSHFVGVDFSETSIHAAREAAEAAGLENIRFEIADLADWQPQETYDYIIAHGVFSWVPDAVKERVLELCSALLTPSGIASIGYNTLPGWSLRRDVAPLIRGLAAGPGAPLGGETAEVVRKLLELSDSGTPYAKHLSAVLENMLRKGGHILGFDDFGPVCDPVYFSQFVNWAAARGLRYLGEADIADNLPENIGPAVIEGLTPMQTDPVMLQQTLDLLSGRTHRSSLLCRDDAPREAGVSTAAVLDFTVTAGRGELPVATTAAAAEFRSALAASTFGAMSPRDFLRDRPRGGDPAHDARDVAAWIFRSARLGLISLRDEPLDHDATPPERPQLSALNLHFARHALPVVDAWHVSCHFPAGHDRLLARMDGSRDRTELAGMARQEFPELDFTRWLAYLAQRGLFV